MAIRVPTGHLGIGMVVVGSDTGEAIFEYIEGFYNTRRTKYLTD